MKHRGFTLVEVLIVVAVIGLLTAAAAQALNPHKESKFIVCTADAQAMRTIVEQTYVQTYPHVPSWEQVQWVAGTRWNPHYHYVPNNYDANKGHGNDLDLCDEENPGKSGEKRDCLDINFIIVCDHDHGEMARYIAVLGDHGVRAFPREQDGGGDQPFLRDVAWWQGKDPNLRKWIGGKGKKK
jgi:prepilin-type N-terminal cleavage/methylation domain-containing protein